MSAEKLETRFVKLDKLSLFNRDGVMTVGVKNGYPRFTFFHREERGKFITAAMDVVTMMQVVTFIRLAANSKEDVKYTMVCKTRDYNTKEVIVQSILIVARRGDDVLIGIKPTHDSKANTTKIAMPLYHEASMNDEMSTSARVSGQTRALAYADLIVMAIKEHCPLDNEERVPNSDRANPSSAPIAAPVAKVDDIDDYVPAPPEGEVKVDEGDDIDF